MQTCLYFCPTHLFSPFYHSLRIIFLFNMICVVIFITLIRLKLFFGFKYKYYHHHYCYYHHPNSPPICFPFEAQREILLSQCKSQTNLDLIPLNHRYCFNKKNFGFFGKMIFNFNKCAFLHTKILSHLILQKLSEVVEQKIRSGGKPSK